MTKALITALSLATLVTSTVFAANEGFIIHRQGIYTVASGHMKALKSILFKDHPATFDVKYHAESILSAFQHHGTAFPEGSHEGKTRALISIWEKPEAFQAAGKKMGEALTGLIEASEFEDLDEMREAFKTVGKGCKNCHDDFREEE